MSFCDTGRSKSPNQVSGGFSGLVVCRRNRSLLLTEEGRAIFQDIKEIFPSY